MNRDDEDCRAVLLHQRGKVHRENQSPDLARQDFEAALRCNITIVGLREEILADLSSKTAPPAGKNWNLFSWMRSKIPGSPNN